MAITYTLDFHAQRQHGLLALDDQILQVLVAQLLARPTLAGRLTTALQLDFHVNALGGRLASRFASALSALFALLERGTIHTN